MEQPGLVERLGYRLGDRLLIINYDDVGFSAAADQAGSRPRWSALGRGYHPSGAHH
jgi:hypothetical protein